MAERVVAKDNIVKKKYILYSPKQQASCCFAGVYSVFKSVIMSQTYMTLKPLPTHSLINYVNNTLWHSYFKKIHQSCEEWDTSFNDASTFFFFFFIVKSWNYSGHISPAHSGITHVFLSNLVPHTIPSVVIIDSFFLFVFFFSAKQRYQKTPVLQLLLLTEFPTCPFFLAFCFWNICVGFSKGAWAGTFSLTWQPVISQRYSKWTCEDESNGK